MLDAILADLSRSDLTAELRGSFWLYPLLNTTHIIGIALLFGGIVPLDLRLIGAWRSVPVAVLSHVLLPAAITGLCLALVTGPLLFVVQPGEYAANPYFQVKLVLIVGAIANALLLRAARPWRDRAAVPGADGARLRLAGALSIGLWLGVLICGRMIGFY